MVLVTMHAYNLDQIERGSNLNFVCVASILSSWRGALKIPQTVPGVLSEHFEKILPISVKASKWQ